MMSIALETLSYRLLVLLLAICIDLIAGVTLALRAKKFEWVRLTDFVQEAAVYLIFWVLAELLVFIPAEIEIEFLDTALPLVGYLVYTVTVAHYLIAFFAKLKTLPIFERSDHVD